MRHAFLLLALLTCAAGVAHAQPAPGPVAGFDVAASIGLFTADRSERRDEGCCSSWSAGFFKGLSVGYYWTDHLKTEVDVGVPGPTEAYSYSNVRLPNGSVASISDERTYTGSKVSGSQVYQFGRNVGFHPYVLGGVDFERERVSLERRTFTGTSPFQEVETSSSSSSVRARAFTGAGFKAYFSERTFFKGEMKLAIGERLNQATWKAGVGIDFASLRRAAATPRARALPPAVSRGRDPVEVWRAYATLLPIGALVDVLAAGEDRLTAELLAVDDAGILVRPRTRVRESSRRIGFDRIEQLRLHLGPSPPARAGAVAAGIGTGAGVFFGVLMMLFAAFGS
jgi:outer membrane protein with beta-barrel domain